MPRDTLGSGDPFDAWSEKIHSLLDEMSNRIFFEFNTAGTWQPRINVYATKRGVLICVELPGFDVGHLSIERVGEARLRLSGERHRPLCAELEEIIASVELLEIDEGRFSREIDLPRDVDLGATEARYERGFLWIYMPRSAS